MVTHPDNMLWIPKGVVLHVKAIDLPSNVQLRPEHTHPSYGNGDTQQEEAPRPRQRISYLIGIRQLRRVFRSFCTKLRDTNAH